MRMRRMTIQEKGQGWKSKILRFEVELVNSGVTLVSEREINMKLADLCNTCEEAYAMSLK